jgi:hypothetical protein
MRSRQISSQIFHPKTNNEQHVAPNPLVFFQKFCRKKSGSYRNPKHVSLIKAALISINNLLINAFYDNFQYRFSEMFRNLWIYENVQLNIQMNSNYFSHSFQYFNLFWI